MATEIFKHKKLLALAYAIANKTLISKHHLVKKTLNGYLRVWYQQNLCEKADLSLINFEIDGAAHKRSSVGTTSYYSTAQNIFACQQR